MIKNTKGKKRGIFYTEHVIEKTLIHHLIEWTATLLSITGALLVAWKIREGFYVWIIANILWIIFAWKHKHYGLLFLAISYAIINIVGLIHWK